MEEKEIWRHIAYTYLVQRARVMPLGHTGKIVDDPETGERCILVPSLDGSPDSKIPIAEGAPAELGSSPEFTIVLGLSGEYHLLFASAETPEEAKELLNEQLILFVREEVGEKGMKRMMHQFKSEGLAANLDPSGLSRFKSKKRFQNKKFT